MFGSEILRGMYHLQLVVLLPLIQHRQVEAAAVGEEEAAAVASLQQRFTARILTHMSEY